MNRILAETSADTRSPIIQRVTSSPSPAPRAKLSIVDVVKSTLDLNQICLMKPIKDRNIVRLIPTGVSIGTLEKLENASSSDSLSSEETQKVIQLFKDMLERQDLKLTFDELKMASHIFLNSNDSLILIKTLGKYLNSFQNKTNLPDPKQINGILQVLCAYPNLYNGENKLPDHLIDPIFTGPKPADSLRALVAFPSA